jgi:cell division protein FtsW
MAKPRPFDRLLFTSVIGLVIGGFLVFMSASLGLLAREGARFPDVAISQFLLGIVGGGIALYVVSHIPYRLYRTYALYVYGIALFVTLLVFVPVLGIELNGARRWLDFGFTTFQPVELLKIGYVLYLAAWLSGRRGKALERPFEGLLPFGIITGVVGMVLLMQPDTGSFLVIVAAGLAMFLAAGAKIKDILILVLIGVIALGTLVMARSYLLDRVITFLNPGDDPRGSGYQIQQSLMAIGSGQMFGRGYGQSVQKFNFLPEPTSDSIFAVYAEEFGFVGSLMLIAAYLLFALRGFWIATRTPDVFGGLVVVGIVILIMAQSFLNIGAMLGVVPLTGLPLIFVSHGGSALVLALVQIGIILNISRYKIA